MGDGAGHGGAGGDDQPAVGAPLEARIRAFGEGFVIRSGKLPIDSLVLSAAGSSPGLMFAPPEALLRGSWGARQAALA